VLWKRDHTTYFYLLSFSPGSPVSVIKYRLCNNPKTLLQQVGPKETNAGSVITMENMSNALDNAGFIPFKIPACWSGFESAEYLEQEPLTEALKRMTLQTPPIKSETELGEETVSRDDSTEDLDEIAPFNTFDQMAIQAQQRVSAFDDQVSEWCPGNIDFQAENMDISLFFNR